ncbi:MAG: hypothetical protein A3E07_01255 [Candidatus Wildermuthbacteria bacterium RIFCSPHIGHO2_12_FULL_45_9]|uniref:EfeO-type cupredoxin-like domain-containing protein n=1 Tax=Candidatus Wildermuthbacteria bacterium RIFCSPHIGHO2_02_FULL_45_25 TaxID=1802450 RepID=A0A1G2QYT1_9BACT|nr:MAG: hypothetical protein A2748_02295 [Candidatus Wildermuthbacteria bacterium RIFCSPHIGHO2_01_FULL_45_20]OHA65750.1 MAG: hypothetical protein A3C04_02435 [Candidatus Wildermuthbacteria bacterium RIFCSPHIGHO2_02_FULL_45_25]OHA70904.1 MAG: hypothetical protein A3E07_01255 [Candidatus Wildermuthbacteria bacterium RIFCSPHIGHO2_12_FULL_45_9]
MTVLEKIAALYDSASDMQIISNYSHNGWGIFLFAVACLMLLAGFGYKKKILSHAVPIILLFMEGIFLIYFFFNRGIEKSLLVGQLIFTFPEIYVHIAMATFTILGNTIELLYVAGKIKNPLAAFAFPSWFIGVGYLNILHPHAGLHDPANMFFHSVLGSLFILTGIMILIYRLIKNPACELAAIITASATLMALSAMLVQYKEPILAYQVYFPIRESGIPALDMKDKGAIYISKDGMIPQNIKIKAGGQVAFIQIDSSWHDISSGLHPIHTEYPPLNIGFLKEGETHLVVFPTSGIFGFHDHINETDTRFQGNIEVYD